MTTSVLIIARNEEKHIAHCIESVINQTKKPDQIVLIAHNCSDRTVSIARNYPVTLIEFTGLSGIIYARIEGLRHVQGDIILCTDGDSYAAQNWVYEMSRLLAKGYVLAGSWMKFKGTAFGWFANFFNKFRSVHSKRVERMIWGPSMAFWGKDKELVRAVFEKSIILSKELGLMRNPDDYWLALAMKQYGTLGMTNKTYVVQTTKEVTNSQAVKRTKDNVSDADKIDAYLHTGGRIIS